MISIYDYRDYKQFVIDWMNDTPNQGRGLRKGLAEAVGCQTPFITHVLSGTYHFSVEQAEACSRWMGIAEPDMEYFILMVSRQRAGTKSLETFYDKQMRKRQTEENLLKKRLKIDETITLEKQIPYYSSWHCAAVHMALMIPQYQSIDALQKYFQLPRGRIVAVVDFLVELHLIRYNGQRLQVLKPIMHLEKSSPLNLQHHTQWRLRATEVMQSNSEENLQYSGVICLSQTDFDWVRAKLSRMLEEIIKRVKTSENEQVACLNFDWFKL